MFLLAEVQICMSLCQCRVSQAFLKQLFTVSLAVSQFGEQNSFFLKEDNFKKCFRHFPKIMI